MTANDLTPEQERQAQALAARIQSRSAEAVLAIARTLVTSTDATLFGATEFAIRKQALGVIADAYTEHLGEKKKWPRRLVDRLPALPRHGLVPRLPRAQS